eukprot:1151652-Pelagomonas_calceolata.AAC.1
MICHVLAMTRKRYLALGFPLPGDSKSPLPEFFNGYSGPQTFHKQEHKWAAHLRAVVNQLKHPISRPMKGTALHKQGCSAPTETCGLA